MCLNCITESWMTLIFLSSWLKTQGYWTKSNVPGGQRLAQGSDMETWTGLVNQYLDAGGTEIKIHIGILVPKKLTGSLRCQFQVYLNASLQFSVLWSWAGGWSRPTKSVSSTFMRTQKISLHFLSYFTTTASKIWCIWELLDLKMLTALHYSQFC